MATKTKIKKKISLNYFNSVSINHFDKTCLLHKQLAEMEECSRLW